MNKLAQIRAKLLEDQNKAQNQQKGRGDNAMFPHWDTPIGKSSIIRFLPDGDNENEFFWVQRTVIKIPFQGVVGTTNSAEVSVQVPCMEMFKESDPILAETRPWWNDESLKPLAKRYWKKNSYLYQGFVVDSSVEEDNIPENPIRRFTISSSIHDTIKASLMDPEIEDMPTDYDNGLDFKITVTKKGEYKDYSTSNWMRRTRKLSTVENEAIEKYGLNNLRDFLPKKPGEAERKAIMEMFHASVNDEAYDPERWGQYYSPYGLNVQKSSDSEENNASVLSKTETTKPAVVEEKEESNTESVSSAPSAIMERIRARRAAQQS